MKYLLFFVSIFILGCNSSVRDLSSVEGETIEYQVAYHQNVPLRMIQDFEMELQALLNDEFGNERLRFVPTKQGENQARYQILFNFKDWQFTDESFNDVIYGEKTITVVNPKTRKKERASAPDIQVNAEEDFFSISNLKITMYSTDISNYSETEQDLMLRGDGNKYRRLLDMTFVKKENISFDHYTVEEKAFFTNLYDINQKIKKNLGEVLYEAMVENK